MIKLWYFPYFLKHVCYFSKKNSRMTGANWLTAKMKINRRILQACMFCLLVLPYGRVSLNRWLFVTRKYKLGFVEDSNPILDSRNKKKGSLSFRWMQSLFSILNTRNLFMLGKLGAIEQYQHTCVCLRL